MKAAPSNRKAPKARAHKAKARVMWSHRMYSDGTIQCHPAMDGYSHREPVVVLPLPLPQAKKLRDFANLSEEERVMRINDALKRLDAKRRADLDLPPIKAYAPVLFRHEARAVLSAIGL